MSITITTNLPKKKVPHYEILVKEKTGRGVDRTRLKRKGSEQII
jgi:hypothetical protein